MDVIKSTWRELKTGSRHKCPRLFYSFIAGETGYELGFTDLIGFWTARSSPKEICNYAKTTRASIDPSEDKSQFQVLLKKLAEGLAQGNNILKQDEQPESEAILLQTTLELRKPLPPLKWEFYLVPQGAGEMAEHILRPCLHQAAESSKQIQNLFEIIAAKDRVIERLLEKIEGSAMDLSLIFPGITGAKARKARVTVKEAQKHVPGLREFDRAKWQQSVNLDGPYAGFAADGLGNLVAGCEKCPKHTTEQHEKWLLRLPKATASTSQVSQTNTLRSCSPTREDSDTDRESEFETQNKRQDHATQPSPHLEQTGPETTLRPPTKLGRGLPQRSLEAQNSRVRSSSPTLPPSPQQSSPEAREHRRGDSDTSTATDASSNPEPATQPKSRIGQLGSKPKPLPSRSISKSASPHLSPSPTRPTTSSKLDSSSPPPGPIPKNSRPQSSSSAASDESSTPRKLGRLGGSRRPIASMMHKKFETSQKQENGGSHQITQSRRLGRLGRGLSQASQSQQQSRPHHSDSDTGMPNVNDRAEDSDASTASGASTSPLTPRAKSLGRLKQPVSPLSARNNDEQNESTLAAKKVEPEPAEGLTKEEIANRRREELKRKLGTTATATGGTGANAGGLRKKRKF